VIGWNFQSAQAFRPHRRPFSARFRLDCKELVFRKTIYVEVRVHKREETFRPHEQRTFYSTPVYPNSPVAAPQSQRPYQGGSSHTKQNHNHRWSRT
jgi:hypothetical protein